MAKWLILPSFTEDSQQIKPGARRYGQKCVSWYITFVVVVDLMHWVLTTFTNDLEVNGGS